MDPAPKLPDLFKFRYNSKFDFEIASGDQLETVHQKIKEISSRNE